MSSKWWVNSLRSCVEILLNNEFFKIKASTNLHVEKSSNTLTYFYEPSTMPSVDMCLFLDIGKKAHFISLLLFLFKTDTKIIKLLFTLRNFEIINFFKFFVFKRNFKTNQILTTDKATLNFLFSLFSWFQST